jgi:hypothetical protein
MRDGGPEGSEERKIALFQNQDLGLAVIQDISGFFSFQAEIHPHDNGPDPGQRKVDFLIVEGIGQKNSHPVPFADR